MMEVSVTSDGHARATASVVGEIDISNADRLARQLLDASPHCGALVVDLSGVTYIDSAGIGELFGAAASLRERRVALAVVVPDESPVRRLLKIAQFQQAAPVFATVDLAADVLTRPGMASAADATSESERPQ